MDFAKVRAINQSVIQASKNINNSNKKLSKAP